MDSQSIDVAKRPVASVLIPRTGLVRIQNATTSMGCFLCHYFRRMEKRLPQEALTSNYFRFIMTVLLRDWLCV
jgi:hypothetical protein